jgi:DNA replication protein DnaC
MLHVDGTEVEGHRRAVVRCECTKARARGDVVAFGSDYSAAADCAHLDGNCSEGATMLIEIRARKYVDHDWERGAGLILVGPSGVGKSFMASAIVNELVKFDCRSAVFATVPAMLDALRNADFAQSARLVAVMHGAGLVVLDDLGAQKCSEWSESVLYGIVAERYGRKAPVIVTANTNLPQLKDNVGTRTYDRLMGFCAGSPTLIEGRSRRWGSGSRS